MENKKVYKTVSFVLALVMLVLALPVPITSQAAVANYPLIMRFNNVVKSLQYLGYDANRLAKEGHLFQEGWYSGKLIKQTNGESYLSKICYDGDATGIETVNGKPNIQSWINSGGLNCASFVAYYYLNYLPNIVGANKTTSDLYKTYHYIKNAVKPYIEDGWSYQSDYMWREAFLKASNANFSVKLPDGSTIKNTGNQFVQRYDAMDYYKELYKINSGTTPSDKQIATYLNGNSEYRLKYIQYFTKGSAISNEKPANQQKIPKLGDTLRPGDLIVMGHYDDNGGLYDMVDGDNKSFSHLALYLGDYNGHSFIAHCTGGAKGFRRTIKINGEDGRGVEISTLEEVFNRATTENAKASYPIEFYHVGGFEEYGTIKINKKDNNGKALAGAKFNIKHSTLDINFDLTTNSNGVAQMDKLPLGTYIVTEIQCPTGFKAGSMSVSKGTVVSTTASSATVTLSGNSTEIVINAVNNPKLTTIYGYKCRPNIDTGFTQISGATIGLFKQSEIQAYKTANPKATYKEIYTSGRAFKTCVSGSRTTSPDGGTNKIGLYYFKDVPFGNYIVAEISTITGFEAPDERSIRYISINNNNYDGFKSVASSVKNIYNDKIRMIGDGDTNGNGDKGAIINYPKYVSIYGFKANANGTSQLSGATIGLFKKADIDTFKKNNPNATYAQIYTSARAIASCVSGSVKTPFNETKAGCYRFDNLEFGSYVIAEIKAPNGYQEPTKDTIRTIIVNDALYNSCTRSFTINGLKNNIVLVNQLTSEEGKSDITNTPSTGSITVYKVDKNGNPLDGAIFGLYKAHKDGSLRTEYPTDFPAGDVFKRVLVQDGEAVFADIPFGEYFVVELKPPAGFKLPNGVVGKDGKFYSTVTLNNAVKVNEATKDVVINDVVNEPVSVTIKAKKVDEKSNPLAGATFELFDRNGNSLETVMSDADGIVNFSTVLTSGTSNYYEIKETKAPFGYRISDIYFRVFPLSNGETRIIKFKNGVPLKDEEGNSILIRTSDQDALLEFTTFVNEPTLGYFKGEKLNEEASPLEGVKFGLYVLENETMTLIEETVTDVNGHFEFDELRIDKKYILKEEKTLDGYIKTNNEWLVTLNANGKASIEIYKESDNDYLIYEDYITVYNYPNELIGFKYENEIVYTDDSKTCIDTSKNALAGLTFYLRDKDGYMKGFTTSDENGIIKFSKIPDGEYIVVEPFDLSGYIKSEETFSFKVENGVIGIVTDSSGNIFNTNAKVGNNIIPIDFAFKNTPNKLYGYKTDETGSVGLNGAVIKLIGTDNNREYECITYSHEGLDGYFEFTKVLGGYYRLVEVVPPQGYTLSGTEHILYISGSTITENEVAYPNGSVAFKNTPNEFTGLKVDHKGNPLENVEFGLFNEQNELVQTAVTNELGEFTFSCIPVGNYTVKETQGLLGYIVSDLVYDLVVSELGIITVSLNGETVDEMTFENNPLPCSITVQKTDREQVTLEGVGFKLEWSKDGKTYNPIKHIDSYDAVEGTTTTLVDENGVIKTDDLGEIMFANLTPNLYYKVTEVEALNGYIAKNEPVYEEYIEISPSPVNAFVGVTNVLSPHKISIEKHNHKGENLADAVFSFEWSQDKVNWKPVVCVEEYLGDKGTTTTIVDDRGCSVTDNEGKLSFENIVPDLYYRVMEVQAPYGYEIVEPIVFEGFISKEDTAKTHEYEVENRPAPRSISILKYDEDNETIIGAKFRLEYSVDNTEWKPVEHTDVFSMEQGKTTTFVTDGEIEVDGYGIAKFEGLTPELYYRVVETKSPEGYTLLKEPFYIGYIDISDALDQTIPVYNNPDFVLPFVGGKAKHSFWFIGTTSGVLMIIAFSLLKNLEVKKNEED